MNKEDIPAVGTKVEIVLNDIFGKPFSHVGKIAKAPYHHGYHCDSGAWCLYPGYGVKEPCYKIEFVPKRCRRPVVLDVKSIVSVREI